jgi:S-methylmethionine-dependent homocysteine/selenocysteine methylase
LVREVVIASCKPLWLSFTVAEDMGPAASARLRSGERVSDAVTAALRMGATAVLFNCSRPEVMGAAVSDAVQVLRAQGGERANLPIGVYANAFVPVEAPVEANAQLSGLRNDVTPKVYLKWARDWVARGARIIGGCCGIGPEHIAELRSLNAS